MNDVQAAMDAFSKDDKVAQVSPLFPTAEKELLEDLRDQYLAANAKLKGKNTLRQKGEGEHDVVRRLIDDYYHKNLANPPVAVIRTLKAGLDCVEGALHEEGVKSLRFDGDVPQRERPGVLEAFRAPSAASHSAHVLLMTVHSGGTGLNIACANHVYFMDRWLDPALKSTGTPSSRCRVDGH